MDNVSDYFRKHWRPLTSHNPTIRYGMSNDGTVKSTDFPPLPALEEWINKILKDLGNGGSEE